MTNEEIAKEIDNLFEEAEKARFDDSAYIAVDELKDWIKELFYEALRQKDEVIVEWMNVAQHHEAKISALEKKIERVQILMQEEINKKDEELFFKKQEISAPDTVVKDGKVTGRLSENAPRNG